MVSRRSDARVSDAGGRPSPWLAFAFAFACFFPYPALPIGSATGLQASQMIALAMIPFIVFRRSSRRHVIAFVALGAALCCSAFASLLFGNIVVAGPMVNTMAMIVLAAIVLIPAGFLVTRTNLAPIGIGVSLAILVHFVVGLIQIDAYEDGKFPLLGFYRNPSFLPLEGVAQDYALWIKRPFGLFPEPSAMTSSLGPWVVVFAGVMLNRTWRARIPGPVRVLFVLAIAAGATLVIMARSGYMPLWVLSLVTVVLFASGRVQSMARKRSPFALVLGIGAFVLLFALAIFVRSQVDSDDVERNESWQARQQSIVIALTAPSRDPSRFLFGFGPGQSATYLQSTWTSDLLPTWYESSSVEPVVAVWSMLGILYMEMGLIAIALFVGLIVGVLRAVMRSSARVLGLSTFGAWLAGVTVTTSYFPLSPIWLCLALLLAWDRVFVPVQVAAPVRLRVLPPVPQIVPGRRYRRVATGVLS